MQTRLGEILRPTIEDILTELRRKEFVYEVPDEYARPGARNEEFENYRIYHLFVGLRKVFEGNRRKLHHKWAGEV